MGQGGGRRGAEPPTRRSPPRSAWRQGQSNFIEIRFAWSTSTCEPGPVPRAHLVLAWMNLLLDWNVDAAMREVQRALELSPSETDAHSFHSTLLSLVGRKSDAVEEVQCMLRLNPAPLLPNQYAAWMYLHVGENARAEAQASHTIP